MDDSVAPLFPVPSCVVFGRKRAIGKAMPATVRAYSGALPMRDASEAMADAAVADGRLRVLEDAPAPTLGLFTGGSPFRSMFRQGATLAPRMLCLIERREIGRLGSDLSAPLVRSRRSTLEKEPWRSEESLENQVEAPFLRPAILGESLLPYRQLGAFEAVIPVTPAGEVMDSAAARDHEDDLVRLAEWMAKAEAVWDRLSANSMTLIDRWNYQKSLEKQFPIPQLRVAYAKAGSLLASCIIHDPAAVIDTSVYWSAPASRSEAYYLIAILNSEVTRARAERYQARGQFGARHFDKVMFNLPIPRFDSRNALHRDLAAAGLSAESAAATVELKEGERFQRARRRIRDALVDLQIAPRIERLVENLLDGAAAD
jgi:hypothetical protein